MRFGIIQPFSPNGLDIVNLSAQKNSDLMSKARNYLFLAAAFGLALGPDINKSHTWSSLNRLKMSPQKDGSGAEEETPKLGISSAAACKRNRSRGKDRPFKISFTFFGILLLPYFGSKRIGQFKPDAA